MAARVATSATWSVRRRRQRETASAAAAAPGSWERRRGPKKAGDQGSALGSRVRTPAAAPTPRAAVSAATPVAVRVTAVATPTRRTSTMLCTWTPVRSANTPRRRCAGASRFTPET